MADMSNGTDESKEFKFSHELEKTVKEVVEDLDPLDSPEFDPVAYINEIFPDERSLTFAKHEADSAGKKRRLHSRLNMKLAGHADKAEKSERMVQEICRDIKSLDHAKKHLTTTISALMKLHMLVQAVDMLVYMSEKKQYKE
eukprot:1327126-Amorphochlora_amoeboformis.AAC.1